jgi:hypothetical protein
MDYLELNPEPEINRIRILETEGKQVTFSSVKQLLEGFLLP